MVREDKEVVLDFSEEAKKEKMREEIETYSERARESGYVGRKRKELEDRGKELEEELEGKS